MEKLNEDMAFMQNIEDKQLGQSSSKVLFLILYAYFFSWLFSDLLKNNWECYPWIFNYDFIKTLFPFYNMENKESRVCVAPA